MTGEKSAYHPARAVESVLLEVIHILGEHRKHVVLIGGMTPFILLNDADEPHVGSFDLDIVVDHRRVDVAAYATIRELLIRHGYRPDDDIPSRFVRTVDIDGHKVDVPVDFLAGEYEGKGRNRRHQAVQGLMLRKLRGADLALINPIQISLAGRLPGGSLDRVTCRVVRPAVFVVLKALALRDRLKSKDAYDIHYVLANYPGGHPRLVADFYDLGDNSVVAEALSVLAEKFASPQHIGPVHAATFRRLTGEEAEVVKRDAFERVAALLSDLDA